MSVRNIPSHSLPIFPSFSLVGNKNVCAENTTATLLTLCTSSFFTIWFCLNLNFQGRIYFANITVCSETQHCSEALLAPKCNVIYTARLLGKTEGSLRCLVIFLFKSTHQYTGFYAVRCLEEKEQQCCQWGHLCLASLPPSSCEGWVEVPGMLRREDSAACSQAGPAAHLQWVLDMPH